MKTRSLTLSDDLQEDLFFLLDLVDLWVPWGPAEQTLHHIRLEDVCGGHPAGQSGHKQLGHPLPIRTHAIENPLPVTNF